MSDQGKIIQPVNHEMALVSVNGEMSYERVPMPSPTAEDLASPEFEALWQKLKTWDVNVPEYYSGYTGLNGSHIKIIIDTLRNAGLIIVPHKPSATLDTPVDG